ncbi:Phosphate uptake regulator [Archaeoglobus sulfaticallidus PM70-1]|uniref:Phosphate uptake regulator n=1 Tax=Archaeoglobus sulfaticallidus PM70-1 TaxID=387631 RepID=N0BK02_9EURY|nr:phosphate uptake regulator PhoU [Archaeoglobus sulfaticallidus]AGK60460.1 Phosphate uptake regulator [Archaeoglobus sulfaticallidus PM70-1]
MVEVRKIFSSGKSSYLITLPKDWIVSNGLKAGDQVFMDVGSERIVIYPKEAVRARKYASIDLREANMDSLIRRIISYYVAGYDSISVKIYSNEQRNAISIASEILIGVEIMEDLGSEIQIEVFLDTERLRPIEIIDRITKICQSIFSDFCLAFENFDKYICTTIIARENETDKLHFLALRLLKLAENYSDLKEKFQLDGKTMEYRTVVRALERIADHSAIIAESLLLLKKPVPEMCEIANFARETVQMAIFSLHREDAELAEETLSMVSKYMEKEKSYYEKILDMEVREALLMKTILDSFFRILNYSADIAEVAINLSA